MTNFNNDASRPRRRVRYAGTHPRHFDEKYKELNFERYPADIEKVLQSGKTPAGTHRPICVEEVLAVLRPAPGAIGLDATLGFGGHAVALLTKILPGGRLFAMDVDPLELGRTEARLRAMGFGESELVIQQGNFAGMANLLRAAGGGFDFILADLGVSSMQLDNPARGFSFKREGPLDLRLNQGRGQPAAALIRSLAEGPLEMLLIENADEPWARPIARAIIRSKNQIQTTTDLTRVIAHSLKRRVGPDAERAVTDSIRRVFQALRIAVNDEFAVLEQFLRTVPFCLKAQGRVAILSFHSGEDRRVMESFAQGRRAGWYAEICQQPIRPSPDEQYANPRSRSAVLRWAIKN